MWGYDLRRNLDIAKDAVGNYSTDMFTDAAVEIISKHKTTSPLFLYFAHQAVHSANSEPLQAPPETIHKFNYIKDVRRRIFAGKLLKKFFRLLLKFLY